LILLDRSARPIIAHRGGMGAAPENTLAAFQRSAREGADAFELDVRLTADGHVVVCHDATIDRTTDARGQISMLKLADVRRADAAARWTGESVGTQRIPLLAEVLDSFPSTAVVVELKSPSAAAPAVEVVKRGAAKDRVVFAAFDDIAIRVARGAGAPTLASRNELLRLLPSMLRGRGARRLPFSAISMSASYYGLPVPVARFARMLDVPVHIWTVNDPDVARRHWVAGARGIVTDYPATMLEARRSSP
jgi:glycerophosphoryl diester phosphodiesterase